LVRTGIDSFEWMDEIILISMFRNRKESVS